MVQLMIKYKNIEGCNGWVVARLRNNVLFHWVIHKRFWNLSNFWDINDQLNLVIIERQTDWTRSRDYNGMIPKQKKMYYYIRWLWRRTQLASRPRSYGKLIAVSCRRLSLYDSFATKFVTKQYQLKYRKICCVFLRKTIPCSWNEKMILGTIIKFQKYLRGVTKIISL